MAKTPARKLKVFQARIGFYDTVVAASSRTAALAAWGTHQNLFASGDAHLAADPAAIAIASDHPQTPLFRPIGSKEAFAIHPRGLPDISAPAGPGPRPSRPRTTPSAKADRRELDAAEAALRALEVGRKKEEAELSDRAARLAGETAAAKARYSAARRSALLKIAAARGRFRKAGKSD